MVVEQVYDHQGNIGNGTVPLLVLDMWEHAYYLQGFAQEVAIASWLRPELHFSHLVRSPAGARPTSPGQRPGSTGPNLIEP